MRDHGRLKFPNPGLMHSETSPETGSSEDEEEPIVKCVSFFCIDALTLSV